MYIVSLSILQKMSVLIECSQTFYFYEIVQMIILVIIIWRQYSSTRFQWFIVKIQFRLMLIVEFYTSVSDIK